MAKERNSILVVDDDADIIDIIVEDLESMDIAIVAAYSASEADRILRAGRRISVVLCDVKMPDKSGIEWLMNLRSRGITMPFVFLSGQETKQHLHQALVLGAINFINKPFSPDILQAAIHAALEIDLHRQAIQAQTIELGKTTDPIKKAELRKKIRKWKRAIGLTQSLNALRKSSLDPS